ncbi:MAG: glycosyltransferase family 1 protein [Actinomycetota bacterium]|nr:glycosyltransferase family 1 protein [Actinomycetota bacterium]
MRVTIVAESFLPEVNGVSNSVVRTAGELASAGHEVAIIAAGHGPTDVDGVPVDRVPAFQLPAYRSLAVGLPGRAVGAILRRQRPDVVHLAAPVVLGAVAARAAARDGIPAVSVFQTDLAAFASGYRLGVTAPAIWRWLHHVHEGTAITLVPSSVTLWDLRRRGFDRLALWPRGVDTNRFSPAHRDPGLRARLAPDGSLLVGYVGRLAAEKRVHLLEPLTHLDGVKVVVVGSGPAERELRARMPKATFCGFRAGRELSELVASFDVFVHTGAHETFCQAMQEALASGVPVVGPAAGGPLDLVRHGVNGWLYPPDDVEMLVAAVRALVAEDATRARMAAAARPSVAERTWPAVTSRLVEQYRAVVAAAAGVPALGRAA